MADAVAEQLGFVPDQADDIGFVPDKADDLGFVPDKPAMTLAPGAERFYEKTAIQGGTPSPSHEATPEPFSMRPIIGPELIPTGAEITAKTGIPKGVTIPASAVGKLGAGIAGFFTSPAGAVQTAGAATPAAPLIYGKWAYDMLKGGVESLKDAKDAISKKIFDSINSGMVSVNQLPKPPPDVTTPEDFSQRLAEDAVNSAAMLLGGAGMAGHAIEGSAAAVGPRILAEPPATDLTAPRAPLPAGEAAAPPPATITPPEAPAGTPERIQTITQRFLDDLKANMTANEVKPPEVAAKPDALGFVPEEKASSVPQPPEPATVEPSATLPAPATPAGEVPPKAPARPQADLDEQNALETVQEAVGLNKVQSARLAELQKAALTPTPESATKGVAAPVTSTVRTADELSAERQRGRVLGNPGMTAVAGSTPVPGAAEIPRRQVSRADAQRPFDLIDHVEGQVGTIDPTLIKEANPDWKPVGAARKLFKKGGTPADSALNALGTGHGVTPDMPLDQFGDALNAAGKVRKGQRQQFYQNERATNEEARQLSKFQKDIGRQSKGTETLVPDDLNEGDVFTLKGAKMKVKRIDYDEDGRVTGLTLDDGKTYGTQEIDGQTALRMDEGSLVKAGQAKFSAGAPEPDADAKYRHATGDKPMRERLERLYPQLKESGDLFGSPESVVPETGKSLFIPLNTKFYEAFKSGEKTEEFRLAGGVWNEKNVYVGKPVVLSKGYGKADRLNGKVIGVRYVENPSELPGWGEVYGNKPGRALAIKIQLDEATTKLRLASPESISDQNARIAREKVSSDAAEAKRTERDRMLEGSQAKLTGADVDTTKEMFGQETRVDKKGQQSLFAGGSEHPGLTPGENRSTISEAINEKHATAERNLGPNPNGGRQWVDDFRNPPRTIFGKLLQRSRLVGDRNKWRDATIEEGFQRTPEGRRLTAMADAVGVKAIFYKADHYAPKGCFSIINGIRHIFINVAHSATERMAIFEHEMAHSAFSAGNTVLRRIADLVDINSPAAVEMRRRYESWNKGKISDGRLREELTADLVAGRNAFDSANTLDAFRDTQKAMELAHEYHGVEMKEGGTQEGAAKFAAGEAVKNLAAVHNTRSDKLRHMLKMGGSPVPSIAIIRPDKAGFDSFGDISLVGNPDLVTPSRDTKVLNADAYSPRYPTVNYFPDQKGVSRLQEMVQKTVSKLTGDHARSFSKFNLFNESPEKNTATALKGSTEMQLAYLDSKGKMPEFTKAADSRYQQGHDTNTVRQLVEYDKTEKPLFDKWVDEQISEHGITETEKIYKGLTNSGNRSYLPHNLDNVVREMKKGFADAEGFNYGVGSIRAIAGKQFRTLEGIQADRDKIVSKPAMDALKKEVDDEFLKLEESAGSYRKNQVNGFGRLDAFSDDMKAMAEGGPENWKYLREQYPGGEPFNDMRAFLEKLKNMPTEYFEAKPKRAVGLHEFTGAVVPEGTDADLIDQLQKRGLDVRTYPKGDQESRRQTVQDLASENKVLFAAGSEEKPFDELKAAHEAALARRQAQIDLPKTISAIDESGAVTKSGLGIQKFFTDDVLKLVRDIPGGAMRLARIARTDFHNLFAPESASKEARVTDALAAKWVQSREQLKQAFQQQVQNQVNFWDAVPDQSRLDFLEAMETGQPINLGKFSDTAKALASQYRDRFDQNYKAEKELGIDISYRQNYFPHIWENSNAATKFFQQLRLSMGQDRYAKMREIDLISEGLKAGLRLVDTNPETLALRRDFDSARIVSQQSFIKELERIGLAEQVKPGGEYGDMTILDAPDGNRYALPPDVARVVDNAFFMKSLWESKTLLGTGFRGLMDLKNLFIPIKLGLSLFHPVHIVGIDNAARLANIVESLQNKNLSFVEAAKLAARSQLNFLRPKGKAFLTAYNRYGWDKELPDNLKQSVHYMIEGGFNPNREGVWKTRSIDGFRRAVTQGNYPGAAIRGLPMLIQAMQKPIFDMWIPRLRAAAFDVRARELIRTRPELASDPIARAVELRKIGKEVDNQYGDMNYSTLFWNRYLRDVGVGSSLSMGWNLGFIREFGGAAIDYSKAAASLAQMKRPEITNKMIFTAAYTGQAMLFGGLMTWALTGKSPTQFMDYFYPRTGHKNDDGSDERLSTPYYTREYFMALSHIKKSGPIGGVGEMIAGKSNPLFSPIIQLYQNKDFFGYEIHDPNSPYIDQAFQTAEFLAKETMPISVASGLESHASTTAKIASYAGFNPAPRYITRTDMQNKIVNLYSRRFGGDNQKLYSKRLEFETKQRIEAALKAGDNETAARLESDAQQNRILSARQIAYLGREREPGDVFMWKRLPLGDKQALFRHMSAEEKTRYPMPR